MPFADRTNLNAYQASWLRERKMKWLADNGPCRGCGSWKALQVDHIDPDQKVSHRIWGWAQERREAELLKCQPLCVKCHKQKSAADHRRHFTHGTRVMYAKAKCRCAPCRAANAAYIKQLRKMARSSSG